MNFEFITSNEQIKELWTVHLLRNATRFNLIIAIVIKALIIKTFAMGKIPVIIVSIRLKTFMWGYE